MSENPFQPPIENSARPQLSPDSVSPNQAAYNIVADTVSGANLRWSDNIWQAIIVFVSMVIFALVGAVLAWVNSSWNLPWYGGAIIGAFAGVVIGVFGSGIFLMIYRAAKHAQGKHD